MDADPGQENNIVEDNMAKAEEMQAGLLAFLEPLDSDSEVFFMQRIEGG